jgi:hypothetical protein
MNEPYEDNRMNGKRMKKGYLLSLLVLGIGIVAGVVLVGQAPPAAAKETVVVYKSPTCGCCKGWVKHLRENGYQVEVHEQYNVTPVKERLGVPRSLRSCHTAQVGGYVIEGHVPASDIQRLLKERPAIDGLAAPGMPMGSPGMEGPRRDPYDVIAYTRGGGTRVYASH